MQFRPQRRHLAFQLIDAAHLLGDEQVAHVTSRQNRDLGCVARRGQRRIALRFRRLRWLHRLRYRRSSNLRRFRRRNHTRRRRWHHSTIPINRYQPVRAHTAGNLAPARETTFDALIADQRWVESGFAEQFDRRFARMVPAHAVVFERFRVGDASRRRFGHHRQRAQIFDFFRTERSPTVAHDVPFRLGVRRPPSTARQSNGLRHAIPLFGLRFGLRCALAIRVCDARPQSDSLFASCSIIPVRMAFFQPFQAVLNPKSPVFVTTKAGEPLIAQRLTRPNKPRCLSAGPLRPPSAYPIRGSAARAPVRLRPLPGPRW